MIDSETTEITDVFFTSRAMDRIREDHPNCGVRGASSLLASSREITQRDVNDMMGTPPPANIRPTKFYLTEDERGIFVIVPAGDRDAGKMCQRICVTFLLLE